MTSKYFALYVLGGALLGFLIANLLPNWEWLDDSTLVAKTIYLNALKMVVVPLIFFSLLSGVLNLRKSRNLSQVGGYTLIYYLGTTAIATLIGLTIVLIFNPWTDITPISINSQTDITFISENDGSLKSVLLNLLNKMLINPFTALSEYNILGILTFAILFGLALATSLPESSQITSS